MSLCVPRERPLDSHVHVRRVVLAPWLSRDGGSPHTSGFSLSPGKQPGLGRGPCKPFPALVFHGLCAPPSGLIHSKSPRPHPEEPWRVDGDPTPRPLVTVYRSRQPSCPRLLSSTPDTLRVFLGSFVCLRCCAVPTAARICSTLGLGMALRTPLLPVSWEKDAYVSCIRKLVHYVRSKR